MKFKQLNFVWPDQKTRKRQIAIFQNGAHALSGQERDQHLKAHKFAKARQ